MTVDDDKKPAKRRLGRSNSERVKRDPPPDVSPIKAASKVQEAPKDEAKEDHKASMFKRLSRSLKMGKGKGKEQDDPPSATHSQESPVLERKKSGFKKFIDSFRKKSSDPATDKHSPSVSPAGSPGTAAKKTDYFKSKKVSVLPFIMSRCSFDFRENTFGFHATGKMKLVSAPLLLGT